MFYVRNRIDMEATTLNLNSPINWIVEKMCQPTADVLWKPVKTGRSISIANECPAGLAPLDDVTTWTCMRNGTWKRSPATVSCVLSCKEPLPTIRGARVIRSRNRGARFIQGDEVRYKCKKRFTQVGGNATRICSNGQWQGQDIICSKEGTS